MSAPPNPPDDAATAEAPGTAAGAPKGAAGGGEHGGRTEPGGDAHRGQTVVTSRRGGAAVARDTIHHPPADALDLAQILRTVGDPLRLEMVRTLAGEGELLCGPLGDRLGLPKSTSSYHVRLLREAGLTRTRQAGTQRFISLRRDDLEARFPGLVGVLTGASGG